MYLRESLQAWRRTVGARRAVRRQIERYVESLPPAELQRTTELDELPGFVSMRDAASAALATARAATPTPPRFTAPRPTAPSPAPSPASTPAPRESAPPPEAPSQPEPVLPAALRWLTPGSETEPEVEPETATEPHLAVEPESAIEPEAAVEPGPAVAPEPALEPGPEVEPEAAVGLEPAVEPEPPAAESEPEPGGAETESPEAVVDRWIQFSKSRRSVGSSEGEASPWLIDEALAGEVPVGDGQPEPTRRSDAEEVKPPDRAGAAARWLVIADESDEGQLPASS